jgi:hypothetical protein
MNRNPVSPKVIVAAIVGILLTSVASNITALTPHMFDFLGPWGLFAFGLVVTCVSSLAAWWKTDPLRVLPEDQTQTTPGPVAPVTGSGSPAVVTGPGTVAQSEAAAAPVAPAPYPDAAAQAAPQ